MTLLTTRHGSFDLYNPLVSMVKVHDVAHSLANLCRFNGHTPRFYSVAEHSLLVARRLPRELQRHGLLHDSAEAYIGDVTRPLRQLLPDFKIIEKRVEKIVFQAFGLPTVLDKRVYEADNSVLQGELAHFLEGKGSGPDYTTPLEARQAFLALYWELTNEQR